MFSKKTYPVDSLTFKQNIAVYFNLHSAMAMFKSVSLNVAQFLSFNNLLPLKQSNALL